MLKNTIGLILVLLVLSSIGCSTIAKQSYYAATGAEGTFYELDPVDPAELATYRSVEIERFTNSLGDHVPEAVMYEVNEKTPAQVAESFLFYPDGKQLRIKGEVIHYTGKSGMKGSMLPVPV